MRCKNYAVGCIYARKVQAKCSAAFADSCVNGDVEVYLSYLTRMRQMTEKQS